MSHALRKLKGGCYTVRLGLAPDLIAFAETQWRGQRFPDIEAYLNCVLNTALFHEMERDPPPSSTASIRFDLRGLVARLIIDIARAKLRSECVNRWNVETHC